MTLHTCYQIPFPKLILLLKINLRGFSYNLTCNEQNWNWPITTGDTASQRCAKLICWAYDATRRHQPTAGNNITCNNLECLDCGSASVRYTRNSRRSVTIQTSGEEDVCHIIYSSALQLCYNRCTEKKKHFFNFETLYRSQFWR